MRFASATQEPELADRGVGCFGVQLSAISGAIAAIRFRIRALLRRHSGSRSAIPPASPCSGSAARFGIARGSACQ
jgi:hypothetical protein